MKVTEYMTLTNPSEAVLGQKKSYQGFAVHGDTAFQYYHSGLVAAFDLKTRAPEPIAVFKFGSFADNEPDKRYANHANDLMFGRTPEGAPLMYITDTMPKSVNAQAVAVNSMVAEAEERFRTKDECAVSLVRMDNGSIFRLMGIGVAGHSIWYRVHGNRGAMEASRGKGYFGPGEVRVWHEPLHLTGEWADTPSERTYYPSWPAFADKIGSAGHGGGDFWVNYHFAEAIRNNEQPYLDVYRACAMSSVGICGWLSVMNNGENVEIPDFKDKVAREKYRSYDKSPFPSQRKLNPEGWIKPSSVGPDDYDYYLKLATAKHNLPRT